MSQDGERLLSVLAAIVEHMPYRGKGDGNGPGHAHKVPGVWDYNGGPMDGRKCDWCKAWADANAIVAEEKAAREVK